MKSLPLTFLPLALLLGGCYTQLATRGDYARGQAAPAYDPEAAPADSLAGDSGQTAAETPAPAGAPTVIVHNHYDSYPYHRGYAAWEWEYPLLLNGYYSSHYVRYHRPYWWDDPWYSGRRIPRGRYDRPREPARPAAPAGPYRSEKRLFNPETEYPPARKGRRSEAPADAPSETAPVPKEGSSGGDGSSGSVSPGSGAESGAEAGKAPAGTRSQDGEDKPAQERRTLQKGRRR